MKKEVGIGILALLAVSLSLWGYKFIQGSNILSRNIELYAYYDDVGGLQIGTPVQISGVTVGAVSKIDLDLASRKVRLTLNLQKDVHVPKSTRAVIVVTSFLGGQAIYLEYDQTCQPGVDCAQKGDVLTAVKRGMLESTLGEDAIDGYMEQLTRGLNQAMDTLNQILLGEDSKSPIAVSARDLQATLLNLKSASGKLDGLLGSAGPNLIATSGDLRKLTATFAAQREHFASIVGQTDSITRQLSRADLEKTVVGLNQTLSDLRATLRTADQTVGNVNGLITGVKQGQGTLGKLVVDDQLYQQLMYMSHRIDSLANDLQQHPYRYMPLKSRNQVRRYDRQDDQE